MNSDSLIIRLITSIVALCISSVLGAGIPLWTFTPLTATTVSVPSNDTATIQYQITNQSNRSHTLNMQSIPGITQITSGSGVCSSPFVLAGKNSCTLSLQVNGSQLTSSIDDGPIVCKHGSILQCYRPATANILHITPTSPITEATITVSDSPLSLTANSGSGTLTVNNTSSIVTATDIMSYFTGTDLDGQVTETGNTCASLAPQASCTLTYTPGNTAIAQTDFTIQGSNTNTATAAIQINAAITLSNINPSSGSASGGTGVTLTGTGLTGATGITFDGDAATSVNVVNSTTVTAVTPAHATGAVDVILTTPSGSATIANGYTYQTTAVGQSAYGGTIACLDGGLNNLIAATADNSTAVTWGGTGTSTSANSNTDGATNTTTIVASLGNNGGTPYAAQLCDNYEVDSQGNSPCESGNTCYNDWFLPAGNNVSGQLNCLYNNQIQIGGFTSVEYWSSTESSASNAWYEHFSNGFQNNMSKSFNYLNIRCVRAFTP